MKLLFELIEIAIGKRKRLSTEKFSTDWKELFKLAEHQGVAAIILDGINKCYEQKYHLNIDFHAKMELIGLSTQMEVLYKQHEDEMLAFIKLLNSAGYRVMVLKGYGLSLNYPIKAHRPVGDLDIWCFGKEKEVDEFLESKGIVIDKSHHHHTVFQYNKLSVENHFDFINRYSRPSNGRIEQRLKELAYGGYYDVNDVIFPSADFNALFLLRHCISHFASTELTIRQALDWAFFMEKSHNLINWDIYLPYIKEEGMYRFYNLLGLFCIKNLGFDAYIFRGLYEDILYERFSKEILSPEFVEHEDGSLLTSLVIKPRRWWHNRWKNSLCYPDSLFSSFVYGLWAKILKPSHFVH